MSLQEDNEKDIQRRERELQQRENAIRLREIEAEIDRSYSQKATEAEIIPSRKRAESPIKSRDWGRKLLKIAKFSGFVIATIVLVRVALWLATVAAIALLGWIGYKLFLEGDKKNSK